MSIFNIFSESSDERVLNESVRILNERNVIKMDKGTMKKRLLSQATLLAAKEANDPLYSKYVKATRIRKECRKLIQVKYASKGKTKMMTYLKNRG